MKRTVWLAIAAASSFVLACIAVARWRAAVPVAPHIDATIRELTMPRDDSLDQSLASAEESIVSNDPFRLANAPASARYDPGDIVVGTTTGVLQPASPRPMMTLKAIVGGPPWQAIIDGLPGQPANTVVRPGSTFEKLVTREVTRDSVVIQGPDTTWVLSFRRPE